MKITKLEPVTRTYCDICEKDITDKGRYGSYDGEGNPVDICGNGRRFIGGKSCEQKFLFKRAFLAGDVDFN